MCCVFLYNDVRRKPSVEPLCVSIYFSEFVQFYCASHTCRDIERCAAIFLYAFSYWAIFFYEKNAKCEVTLLLICVGLRLFTYMPTLSYIFVYHMRRKLSAEPVCFHLCYFSNSMFSHRLCFHVQYTYQ